MRIRSVIKYILHNYIPGWRGVFKYFNTPIYFPLESKSFLTICDQGIFEADNLYISIGAIKPNTVVYDIGANIGQMAAPLLDLRRDIRVVSFEPSPSSLPWLRRTIEQSTYSERWSLVEKAVGSHEGVVDFYLAPVGLSLFEGTAHTDRAPLLQITSVPVVTLDKIWEEQERPPVSFIKIDTEGGEVDVLLGAEMLIGACRPTILLEWNSANLAARDTEPQVLLTLGKRLGYDVYTVPGLSLIRTPDLLRVAMSVTESFLLSPAGHDLTEPSRLPLSH